MQKIFILEPNEVLKRWSTTLLETELQDGWKVITATPVMRNINQVSSTAFIIYVLEKEEEE